MKKKVIACSICVLLLAGCNPKSSQPTPTAAPSQVASATPPTDQDNLETPTSDQADSETLQSNQKALKDEWGQAYNHSTALFAICETMFVTQAEYGRGEIDITKAKLGFATEDNFLTIVYKWQVNWVVTGDAVVPYYQSLWNDMEALIDISFQLSQMDGDEIASPEIIEAMNEACEALFYTNHQIASAALDAGLTDESLNEVYADIKEIIDDIYAITG